MEKYFIDKFEKELLDFLNKKNLQNTSNNDFKSANILVTSKFGFGKTTLKNEILDYLFKNDEKNKNQYLIFDVNIWLSNLRHIDEIIMMTILSKINADKIKMKKQILKNLSSNLLNCAKETNQVINLLIETTKDLELKGQSRFINYLENKYKINFYLDDLIKFVLKKYQKQKIIFLYDELDRCTHEFIRDFFNRIKGLFNNKNLIHIIFANEEYINSIFSVDYINPSEKFIDKYFDYKHKLTENVQEFFDKKWKLLFNDEEKITSELSNYYYFFTKITFRDISKNINDINKLFDYVKNNHNGNKIEKIDKLDTQGVLLDMYLSNDWLIFILFLIAKGYRTVQKHDLKYIYNEWIKDYVKTSDNYEYLKKIIDLHENYELKYGKCVDGKCSYFWIMVPKIKTTFKDFNNNEQNFSNENNENNFYFYLLINLYISNQFISPKRSFNDEKTTIDDLNDLIPFINDKINKILN